MNKYKIIEKCRCCDGDIIEVLDLNDQPLANSYHNMEELDLFPLKLNVCKSCYHAQLSVVVDPNLMFKNYLYVSGTATTLQKYFDYFAKFTIYNYKTYNGANPKNVLDIACNDGTQLNYYKDNDLETYGVDPAENLHGISSINHNVICDYFPTEKLTRKFDLITAQNVFAHTDNIYDFLLKCKELLDEKGILYIQTSQANMFVNGEFDTIYHEHLSFFNTKSMLSIVNRCGLHLTNVFKSDIHGISYIFEIRLSPVENSNVPQNLEHEELAGLYKPETYTKFAENSLKVVSDLKNAIKKYKDLDYYIVGYGAAAKGMTLLNFGDISLDLIIDDNPLKHDLYTPGTNILIKGISELEKIDKKIVFIPLAWNFYSEIKTRINKIRNTENDIFIKYFPSYKEE